MGMKSVTQLALEAYDRYIEEGTTDYGLLLSIADDLANELSRYFDEDEDWVE
jgi:hypothetical protein